MKHIYIVWWLAGILFLAGCYKDRGNYSYHDINVLEVDSIRPTYSVDVDDSLLITPVLKGSMYSDTSRFEYEWEIGGRRMAQTYDLRMLVNLVPSDYYSRYIVKDKETGVKSYHEFRVRVNSSTAADLIMVLSKYQGRAELSYLRLDKPANWAVNYFKDRYGYSLGTHPQQLTICYTESARTTPFVNRFGRVMVLTDNEVKLLDKSSLMQDTLSPVLTVDAYLQLVSYPKPDIENYKSEFIDEVIELWRYVNKNKQMSNNLMEISAGRVFSVASMAPGIWTTRYAYDQKSPYEKGYFDPFGYWDDMSETPNDNNIQAGFKPGQFIVFDRKNSRFAFTDQYGQMAQIRLEDVPAYPGHNLIWGSATNRPNRGSVAVLTDGSQCRLLMLEHGTYKDEKDQDRETKKLIGEVSGGATMDAASKFYMMKYGDNLFYSKGNTLYRYNILNISEKNAPTPQNKVFDLTQYGYDASAVITDICVSRTERTMLVGVSRYGDDAEALGDEAKGDILYFDLDSSTTRLTYNEEKSYKGVAGIPVNVKIKYKTHYRNGIDQDGILQDNI